MFGGISPGNASMSIPFFQPSDAFGRVIPSDVGSISDMWRLNISTSNEGHIHIMCNALLTSNKEKLHS